MTDFDYDVMQRKRIARMAKYRKGGSKSKKCPMSTDHMTRKQWEERCGEVHTYSMNEPKSWERFKQMPVHIQKEYLEGLVRDYNVNAASLGEMFNVQAATVRRHIDTHNLGLTFKVGNSMKPAQREEWEKFLNNRTDYVEDVDCSDVQHDLEQVAEEEVPESRMDMKQFSLTFQGVIDVNMIANSIISIIGQGAVGTVEIVCTM